MNGVAVVFNVLSSFIGPGRGWIVTLKEELPDDVTSSALNRVCYQATLCTNHRIRSLPRWQNFPWLVLASFHPRTTRMGLILSSLNGLATIFGVKWRAAHVLRLLRCIWSILDPWIAQQSSCCQKDLCHLIQCGITIILIVFVATRRTEHNHHPSRSQRYHKREACDSPPRWLGFCTSRPCQPQYQGWCRVLAGTLSRPWTCQRRQSPYPISWKCIYQTLRFS